MQETIELTPEIVEQKALTIPEQAKGIAVIDNASLLISNEILLRIKDIRKEISEAFDPIIKKAYEAHKTAVAQKKKAEAPLIEAEGYIKPQIATYIAEQERKRREEEERLRQEALRAEEERKLQEAIIAEQEGNQEEAEAILNEQTFIPPPIVEKATPKLQGVSISKVWKFRVVNPDVIPRMYLLPDIVKIGQIVRSLKGSTNIPGIEVYTEDSVSAGRR